MTKYWDKFRRDKKIVQSYVEGGFTTKAIAIGYKLSIRTVQRILREAGVER